MGSRRSIAAAPRDYFDAEWLEADADLVPRPAVVAQAIGRRIKELADAAGSVRQLADQCGLNHVTIGHAINGTRWASIATIAMIEEATGERVWPQMPLDGAAGP